MKIATEKLLILSFVFLFCGSWSFFGDVQFTVWILRFLVFGQAFLYAAELVDRFRL